MSHSIISFTNTFAYFIFMLLHGSGYPIYINAGKVTDIVYTLPCIIEWLSGSLYQQ